MSRPLQCTLAHLSRTSSRKPQPHDLSIPSMVPNSRRHHLLSLPKSGVAYHEETALGEIRRKMRQAQMPGETEMRGNIKRLVTEAHKTSAHSRTEVHKALLTEWKPQRTLPQPQTPDVRTREVVYVDASKSGIGFYLKGQWQSWVLNPSSWRDNFQIVWAEAVAAELGLRLLVTAGLSDCKVRLHSDNKKVVDAIRSNDIYETHVGEIVYCINCLCRINNINRSVEWISGRKNPANGPSRLLVRDEHRRFPFDIDIPDRLRDIVFPYRNPM